MPEVGVSKDIQIPRVLPEERTKKDVSVQVFNGSPNKQNSGSRPELQGGGEQCMGGLMEDKQTDRTSQGEEPSRFYPSAKKLQDPSMMSCDVHDYLTKRFTEAESLIGA